MHYNNRPSRTKFIQQGAMAVAGVMLADTLPVFSPLAGDEVRLFRQQADTYGSGIKRLLSCANNDKINPVHPTEYY